MIHQYIHRESAAVRTEKLFGDRIVNFIYSTAREKAGLLYNAVTSARVSALLGYINYSLPWGNIVTGGERLIRELGVDVEECVDPPSALNTPKKIFERKIRYWERRPMSGNPDAIVSPADARMIVGSFAEESGLFLNEKFFSFSELFADGQCPDKANWATVFSGGAFAVFRLTPEKYHYNHIPVSGTVIDIYEIAGVYHSCNPTATIHVVTPFSKNRRVVTIIDTDVAGGSRIGRVAVIEIVALMIGDIVQCYSDYQYERPRIVTEGMLVSKGQPKSLYRPGSSVDVVVFQKDKVRFCEDIVNNMHRTDAQGRFSKGFGRPLIETEVAVRSTIAYRSKH